MKLIYLSSILKLCYGILERRLVGASPTTAKPWVVFLKHPKTFCGGTLYTESLVITAAHCNTHLITDWKAYVNLHSIKSLYNHRETNDVLLRVNHPRFKGFGSFDVSVWWILGQSNKQTQVRLDDGLELKKIFQRVKVLGWGNTAQVTPAQIKARLIPISNPEVLEVINIPLVADSICQLRYPNHFISDTMFCMGQSNCGPGTGSGDSGGPVYREHNNYIILMGLVNFGGACGYRDYYDVNTKISNPSISNFINHYKVFFKPQFIKNGLINTRIIHYQDKVSPQQSIQLGLQNNQLIKAQHIRLNTNMIPSKNYFHAPKNLIFTQRSFK